MMKSQLFPDAPLTDTEFTQLDKTVIDAARRQLVGRRFIELYGPLGRGRPKHSKRCVYRKF
jgi:uncharacterized linocin/CFP29 family protein